ncbi:MAG: two-component system sensor histidine kinase ChvG [Gammaproteobacteria bacterium]|jgi:two-component system sensor histidine kinase ChvG
MAWVIDGSDGPLIRRQSMPKITIRVKLAMLSIAMLSIPYVGFQYLRETERYLQSSLEDSLLAVGGALAFSLQNQSAVFRSSSGNTQSPDPIFSHTLDYPVHIDGYIDDWEGYLQWADHFETSDHLALATRQAPAFDLIVGEHEQYLNVLVLVSDDSYVYQDGGSFEPQAADTIELMTYETDGSTKSIYLSTAGPGPVTAYDISENWDFSTTRNPISNVFGQWRETALGYAVEIRIPLNMVGNALGISVYDKDVGVSESLRASTMGEQIAAAPNPLLRTSAMLQQTIQKIGLKQGRRVWVINRTGQVLASTGTLVSETKRGAINFIYTWILPIASGTFDDELRSASRLRGAEVLQALSGRAATRWRSSADERAIIVSAAQPVRSGNELVGAVVVEETTNSIQTVQRDAMAALFNKSIGVFAGVSLILLIFASRLSYRIAKLRDQSERAIDRHGRVVGSISRSSASDEIGDLSRSYSAMLVRLKDYNAYLESMASKLTHELRTPLTVVSSSLQNLDSTTLNLDQEKYLDRAREGIERLHNLVSRLSEASRIEQSVSNVEFELFDLAALIRGSVDGYENAYAGNHFELKLPNVACEVLASDDLLAQLLDKLIDNAVAFSIEQKAIEVSLSFNDDVYLIEVKNYGRLLPEAMQNELFNSMVSVRSEAQSGDLHLGLGLHIARLIAEIHQGRIVAKNLDTGDGVSFTVSLSRQRRDVPR